MKIKACILLSAALASSLQTTECFKPKSAISPIKNEVHHAEYFGSKVTKRNVQQLKGGASDSSKSSLSTAMFNLVKGIVGAGVLSLPAGVAAFGDANGAILPAVLLITIMGSFSGYNFSLIGRICAFTGASSYSEGWEKSVGEKSSWIPALACSLSTFAAILAYSMILAETFQGIATSVGLKASRTQSLVALTVTVLYPLCKMKNLASLAPFSLLGILGMALTVACMAVRYFDGSYALPSGKFVESLSTIPEFGTNGASSVLSPNAFILICMLSTAFMAHFNAPKFYIELENNTIARFNILVAVSFGVSIAFFSVATAIGFGTFGKSSLGYILSNYSANDKLISASRIAVAFALIFTYPLVFVGCRDGFLSLMKVPEDKQTDKLFNSLTVGLLVLVTVAACTLKDLSFVMSFGGATFGNALIYVFPAIMFRNVVKNMGDDAPVALKKETYFATFSMLLGIGMGIIGSIMALKGL
jgi:amino acid permease